MRVIAGTARRLKLVTPEGMNTRPTGDQIKETLFNMLMPYIYDDTRFLDLFAGSGQIGIEALSRGAEYACFCDNDRRSVECIQENLVTTKLTERARVIPGDCLSAVRQLKGGNFDIVFMDPPYDLGVEADVLRALDEGQVLADDPLIVIEARLGRNFSFVTELGFDIIKEKEYKSSKHVFLKRKSD